MLKKSASFVLASLRGSTYRSVRLTSWLAAALLDGLFEHPADYSDTLTLRIITAACRTKAEFFRKLLMGKTMRSRSQACLLPQWGFAPCR